MPDLSTRLEKLPEFLAERVQRYRVPGATLAVWCDGELFETAAGVVNVDTGVRATPDAVFQIGSITKVLTTTLLMQLVDEGRLDLDQPVRTWLPELELADPTAAATVTPRHLLTHTSGIDGDHFVDTGRGDEAVERFVVACMALPQLHPVGRGFSYCNAGFVIAGRIVEKLRARPWGRALREHLLAPIGAKSLHTDPAWALYYRAAIGHLPDAEGDSRVVPFPMLGASNAPAGATPFGAARDLIAFARMHLDGGRAPDGTAVLSDASVRAMQTSQRELPEGGQSEAIGLGWMLDDWDGTRVIGHDGGTIGQASCLRIVPDRGLAVALLMNGGNTAALRRRVLERVVGELAGAVPPPLPEPRDIALDLARYTGRYERLVSHALVTARDGTLRMRGISQHPPVPEPEIEVELRPASEACFVWSAPGSRLVQTAVFLEPDADGRFRYLHFGGRTMPRTRRDAPEPG